MQTPTNLVLILTAVMPTCREVDLLESDGTFEGDLDCSLFNAVLALCAVRESIAE